MKRKKKGLKKLRDFIIFILLCICFFTITNRLNNISGESVNKKYNGVGQKVIDNKKGYNTIFITNNINTQKQYIEYKQDGESPWAKNDYWGGTMAENGCGITAIAIIASGYGKSVTPEDLRKIYAPHLEGENISKELNNSFGIKCTDFIFSSAYFSENKIIEHLSNNRPILICVWDKPNTSWTEKSHYMVLLATDGKDKVYVSNPSDEKEDRKSGWYDIEDVRPYIAKALFIEE